jgi:hypothetical protein
LTGNKGWRRSAPEFATHLFGRQIMKRIALAASLALALLALGACGTSTSDRAISGGGIGAGAGALTNKDQINLGKPVWR